MAVKLKKKTEPSNLKKVQIILRVSENDKEDLELLASECEGVSTIQDVIAIAIKDILKSNTSLLEELRNTKGIPKNKLSEDEELKKLIEEETKK